MARQAPPSEGMDEITCLLCNKFLSDPKYLPCLHVYCRECVQQHVDGTDQSLLCPACHKMVVISQSDASKLPSALTIDSMRELHCRLSQGEIKCGVCSESASTRPSKVDSYCRHCNEFICNLCEDAHRRMLPFKSHLVVTIEILKQNIRQSLPLKIRLSKCPCHNEDLDMYCSTCEELICMKCLTDQQHSDHKHRFVKHFAPEAKEELGENLKLLKKHSKDITSAIEKVESVKSKIIDQAKRARPEICQGFEEALKVIEERRQELLKSMDSITQKKVKDLEDQLRKLKSSSSERMKLMKSIDQQLTPGNNTEEVTALRSWMLDRMQEESKEYEHLELEPVALANISVNISCARQIAELLQRCTTVSFLADPSKCEVEKEGLCSAETDKPVTVNVHTLYPDEQPCREEQDVQVELRSLADNSLVPTEINSKGKGTYEILFCPGIRGRHELSVKIQGIPISDSPFKFFVEHHPTKLIKPVDCIEGLEGPYGAAFNFDGDLLVTQAATIGIVTKEEGGYRVNPVPIDADQLQRPRGIDTNEDFSCTYVTDSKGDSIMKYTNWNWKCINSSRGHPGEEFRRTGRVKISPDHKLYVCDRGNDRIQVFDCDLKPVQMFETKEVFGRPVDVAFDDTGHIYVSDLNRNQILKFDSQGNLQLAIGNHGSGPGELSSPRGLYIHKNFIYVNERDNKRTSVFCTDGKFVTTFGEETKFQDPASIIADKDGFLYICDEESNCVFVF